MARKTRTVASIVIAGLLTVPLGCSGTSQAGTPYTLKIDRELRAFIPLDLNTTHTTARSMLEDEFLFEITNDALDAREGIIEATTAKDRAVRLETYAMGDQTAVEVFVGPFGDYRAAEDIFSSLERRLGVYAQQ